MKFDSKNYNVLDMDDYVVGLVQDVITTFKEAAKVLINDMKEEDSDEKTREIDEMLELVNALYQDIITDKLYFNSLIKVYYSGMGQYRYHILEEKEI